jgi:predicted kinase
MRKWMRERLQRRKKNTAEPTDQPAAPPLQPAYFDVEEQPSTLPEENDAETATAQPVAARSQPVEEAGTESGIPAPDAEPSEASTPKPARGTSDSASKTRRRRGGRGRGGRGREQAVAQAFAPKVLPKSSSIVPGAELTEDESPEIGEPQSEAPGPVAPTPEAPVIPSAPVRPPKGIVVLAIGLPGSGKSTWFKRHNLMPLSSDMVRSLLFDDVREQRFQDLVFSNLRSMLKARLIAKRPMNYVDATNLTPQERQHWIKLAKDYGYEVQAVFFDVPLDVCIDRHNRRDRVVPEDVMRRMAAKLKPPAFEEGFAKITVVRVKKKEAGAAQ